jgi:hypothetical protein
MLEYTKGAIKYGQSRETDNIGYTRWKREKEKKELSPSWWFSKIFILEIVCTLEIYRSTW